MNPDRISQTAAFIAIKFYGLTLSPPFRSLFDPDVVRFYERIVRTLPSPLDACHGLLKRKWLRSFFTFAEELLLPGDLLHILNRKYGIGQAVGRALSEDFEQIVILGAGFDHLGATYSQQGIRCIEIDRPIMAGFKRRFHKKFDYHNPLLFVEDLQVNQTSLGRLLSEKNGPDPDRNTLVVTEGFFDYISPSEMTAVLEELDLFFNRKIRMVSTLFALDELPVCRRWIFKAGVRAVGEKIRLELSKRRFKELLEQNRFPIFSTVQPSVLPVVEAGGNGYGLDTLEGFYLVQAHRLQKK